MALPGHLALLEEWLRNYRVEELFEADGRLMPVLAKRAPDGERRMEENPHSNGAILLRDMEMPGFCVYACDVATPAILGIGDTRRRTIHANLQVRGYKEEGTVTTPFDMTVRNDPDRVHRLMVSIDRLPQTDEKGQPLKRNLSKSWWSIASTSIRIAMTCPKFATANGRRMHRPCRMSTTRLEGICDRASQAGDAANS